MKHYVRTCLSLDNETNNKTQEIANKLKTSLSKTVKIAIEFYWEHKNLWDHK